MKPVGLAKYLTQHDDKTPVYLKIIAAIFFCIGFGLFLWSIEHFNK